ncbi:alpha/beta hydrolase family protein [Bacillus sp. CGMCC 1.16607]|uniref:alpha/beta hydrolase family protein n=1 Tax=Bacillus sp. CGMCC 1.16607 TaxID=3351842 RepID=UPI003641E573
MSKEEKVSFYSGIHRLTGLLRLPSTNERSPAVIFLQGSEYTSPLNSRFLMRISDYLIDHGIACLIFNKRGVGDSSGSKWKCTFEDRANDALAALDFMKTRKEIDAAMIGLFGHSQGGWICQLAATKSSEMAFIINSAGPGESVFEQILTDSRNHLIIDGVPENKVNKKIGQIALLLKLILKLKPIIKFHPLSYMIDYDPKPIIGSINCPVLALFGELDPLTPPTKNIPIFEEAFKRAGKNNYVIKTFPKANHSFYLAKTGSLKEYSQLTKEFVPYYLETITDWILSNTKQVD